MKTLLEDIYKCPKCHGPFHYQSPRSWWVKTFFPNRPTRRFFCGKCVKHFYVPVDPSHLRRRH